MATYLFTATRVEKDEDGRLQLNTEGFLLEVEVEATSNQEAINKGLLELDMKHPDEDLNSLVFGACSSRN